MENEIRVPLGFKEFRRESGEIDDTAPLFFDLHKDLCDYYQTGVITSGVGSVTTVVTLFDYQRTDSREYLLYRWTLTSQVAGLHFPKKTTRYSVAIFEKNVIAEVLAMTALKGQAVAWWIARDQSPIAKIRDRGWL